MPGILVYRDFCLEFPAVRYLHVCHNLWLNFHPISKHSFSVILSLSSPNSILLFCLAFEANSIRTYSSPVTRAFCAASSVAHICHIT